MVPKVIVYTEMVSVISEPFISTHDLNLAFKRFCMVFSDIAHTVRMEDFNHHSGTGLVEFTNKVLQLTMSSGPYTTKFPLSSDPTALACPAAKK